MKNNNFNAKIGKLKLDKIQTSRVTVSTSQKFNRKGITKKTQPRKKQIIKEKALEA